jgi:hypothetical protein
VIVFPLPQSQTKPTSKGLRDAAQLDRHRSRSFGARIASQPLCPRKPIVRPLRTGKGRRRDGGESRGARFDLDGDALMAQQLDARPSVLPTTPVPPEQRLRPNDERMQKHTHLAGLGGRTAIPLTLLAQRAGTTTANAGRIHHAQASISLSAPLMRHKRLASRATQRAVGLEDEILPREATSFPGQAYLRGSIARRRSCVCWDRWESLSKLGRAHRIRMELMAQLQTQIPDPLRHDLLCFLAHCSMATPAVGVLFLVFISQCILKGPTMQIQRHHITGGKRVLGKLRQE